MVLCFLFLNFEESKICVLLDQSNKFKFKNMKMHNSFFVQDEKEKWILFVKQRILKNDISNLDLSMFRWIDNESALESLLGFEELKILNLSSFFLSRGVTYVKFEISNINIEQLDISENNDLVCLEILDLKENNFTLKNLNLSSKIN